jgi:hypothetical protein
MLHGRSERRGDSVAIRGLTRANRARNTYFGQLAPARIDARFFTLLTLSLGHDDLDWTRDAAVVLNHDKPRITPHEEAELRRWWKRKRERQHWNRHEP